MKKPMILMVEDDEQFRPFLRKTLEMLDFDCMSCASGTAAVSAFQRSSDELAAVVMDVQLPGMLGNQAAREMHEHNPAIPIILISGVAEERILKDAPYDFFLKKPFTIDQLAESIKLVTNA
jgi:two-component system, NtrC family, C4-dicarboxylate transport response regulator DctD